MKNWISRLLGLLLALGLIAGVCFAAWWGLAQLLAMFAELDAQVAPVTAIASVVVLAAALIVAAAVRRAGRDRLAVPGREEKAATYRLFVDCWQQRLGGSPTPAVEESLSALERLLAVCGSPSVIGSHMTLRRLVEQTPIARADWLPLLSGALLQIRKELNADAVAADELEALLAPPAAEPIREATAPVTGSLSAI